MTDKKGGAKKKIDEDLPDYDDVEYDEDGENAEA